MMLNDLYQEIILIHAELDRVLEKNNYDLLSKEVISISKKLDEILNLYHKAINTNLD